MSKRKKKKLILAVVCLAVVLCAVVSGTVAYLIAKTPTVTNTFSPSNIALDLKETPENFDGKMIPGKVLDKKATVTVTADIPCYVFVEVIKANDLDNYVAYAVDTAVWTKLTTNDGKLVYYKAVASGADNGLTFDILTSGGTAPYAWGANQVLVRPTVTKAMMDALCAENAQMPKLTFKAYAIQSDYLEYGEETDEAAKALIAWNTLQAGVNND